MEQSRYFKEWFEGGVANPISEYLNVRSSFRNTIAKWWKHNNWTHFSKNNVEKDTWSVFLDCSSLEVSPPYWLMKARFTTPTPHPVVAVVFHRVFVYSLACLGTHYISPPRLALKLIIFLLLFTGCWRLQICATSGGGEALKRDFICVLLRCAKTERQGGFLLLSKTRQPSCLSAHVWEGGGDR